MIVKSIFYTLSQKFATKHDGLMVNFVLDGCLLPTISICCVRPVLEFRAVMIPICSNSNAYIKMIEIFLSVYMRP